LHNSLTRYILQILQITKRKEGEMPVIGFFGGIALLLLGGAAIWSAIQDLDEGYASCSYVLVQIIIGLILIALACALMAWVSDKYG
jgi:hypothetical protein